MFYNQLKKLDKGLFALLIDPDKNESYRLKGLAQSAQNAGVDVFLLGGSLISTDIEQSLTIIRENSSIPIVLFPGNAVQFTPNADGILLLSLISGRNPDFLIGNHILVSHAIHKSGMEVIPTGYILIESGNTTSVQYMSNTKPIPRDKSDIVVATALAGQQLGLKSIYLEAGSGALEPVPEILIREVKRKVSIPLIVGGGIRDSQSVAKARAAGADMVVVGNAIEQNGDLLAEMVSACR